MVISLKTIVNNISIITEEICFNLPGFETPTLHPFPHMSFHRGGGDDPPIAKKVDFLKNTQHAQKIFSYQNHFSVM